MAEQSGLVSELAARDAVAMWPSLRDRSPVPTQLVAKSLWLQAVVVQVAHFRCPVVPVNPKLVATFLLPVLAVR